MSRRENMVSSAIQPAGLSFSLSVSFSYIPFSLSLSPSIPLSHLSYPSHSLPFSLSLSLPSSLPPSLPLCLSPSTSLPPPLPSLPVGCPWIWFSAEGSYTIDSVAVWTNFLHCHDVIYLGLLSWGLWGNLFTNTMNPRSDNLVCVPLQVCSCAQTKTGTSY